NPAGFHATRNWPLDRYAAFAQRWQQRYPSSRFVVMGYAAMQAKAEALQKHLGETLVDLTGKTSIHQALDILRRSQLVLSEDSGLMHLAWVQGVPTLAIFGSSRYDWSRPCGPHSDTLCALDLECIGCLSNTCQHGDNRCLTRFTPEQVEKAALVLLEKQPH
ncbi:MAG: glycosyltransferase family 9 protein, partial [Bacteroidota bacterium]